MASVLVVRKFDEFSRVLIENGFSVINCPVIETSASNDLSDLESRIVGIDNYDGIFFTSPVAALVFVNRIAELKPDFHGRVFALGRRCFEQLKGCGLDVYFNEGANTAAEMLDSIPKAELKSRRFLFVRGERSLRTIAEYLKDMAVVDETVVYKTISLEIAEDIQNNIRRAADDGNIAAICFFSPSGAENLLAQIDGDLIAATRIAAIGGTTADYLTKKGFRVDLISESTAAENFAREVVEFLRKIS